MPLIARLSRLLASASAGLLASLLAVAAQAAGPSPGAPALDNASVASAGAGYRITRGDELNFRFFYTPELNTVATVRSDGRVALPLIGEMVVDGMTIAELGAAIEGRLAAQVRRPQVVINVQGSASQRVFVGGEVARPGVQPLVGPLSVLQAVMAAEGLRESAQPRGAIVIRRGPAGERLVLPVDLSAVMDGSDSAKDVALQPYDVVIVPRSGIANLNLWVDQYIKKVIPLSLGFSYTINQGSSR